QAAPAALVEELEGDLTAKLEVPGAVDDSHAPLADAAQDPEMGDLLAGMELVAVLAILTVAAGGRALRVDGSVDQRGVRVRQRGAAGGAGVVELGVGGAAARADERSHQSPFPLRWRASSFCRWLRWRPASRAARETLPSQRRISSVRKRPSTTLTAASQAAFRALPVS